MGERSETVHGGADLESDIERVGEAGRLRGLFDAPDAIEVIRLRATRRWVVRRGRVIAETTPA